MKITVRVVNFFICDLKVCPHLVGNVLDKALERIHDLWVQQKWVDIKDLASVPEGHESIEGVDTMSEN